MSRRCPTMLGALLLLAAPALGQETLWPAPRGAHALEWHGGLELVVLHGGAPEDDARSAWLWGWDGVNWTGLDSAGPGNRLHAGLAYDARRDRLVLHGGLSRPATPGDEPGRYGDTWEWSADGWRRFAGSGPGVRDHTAMAYDPDREVVILFGGSGPDGSLLGDTWVWDGAEWSEAPGPGPPPRSTHRLVRDHSSGTVLLFGGYGEDGLLADTWAWDGVWTRVAEDEKGPSPRFATRMAYDVARGEIVLYGGRGADGDLADTWVWNGARWIPRSVDGPGPRNVHAMAYDPTRQRVVLFGGIHDGERYADVWEWDGVGWESIYPD